MPLLVLPCSWRLRRVASTPTHVLEEAKSEAIIRAWCWSVLVLVCCELVLATHTMCDCVSLTRRYICRDWCGDALDCCEAGRSSIAEFCDGFSAEACGSLLPRDPCGCCRDCSCNAGECGASCGRGLAQGICGVFHTVRHIPGFLLGLLIIALVVGGVVWYIRWGVPTAPDAATLAKSLVNATVG